MSKQVIKTFLHLNGKRRVQIYQRADNSFGFEEEYFSEEPMEKVWIPFGQYSNSICPSLELAIREAQGRVEWLSNQSQV